MITGLGRWPLAVRAAIVLAGTALLVLPGSLHPVPFFITAAGVAAAVAVPRTVGVSIATTGFVMAWIAADGWAGTLPVGRTVGAAAALYVLHVSVAFAACLPLRARVDRAVMVRWASRCALPVPVAAALIVADEVLPRANGTPWVEFGGLLAALLLGAGAVYAVRRRSAPLVSMEGRAGPK